MKKDFKKLLGVVLALVLVITSATSVFAANFRDVADVRWAHNAIDAVSRLGILTGDLSGNFNPRANIDKFETVRVFARMHGFDPATLSPADAVYHNMIYQQRSATISNVSQNFTRWNASANREIAYLLYRGILLPSDLNNFIVVENGVERMRALSREEAAVFLVRFMERVPQALANANVTTFLDDAQISPSARAHIYFLRSLGIMNGSQNRVYPRNAVTRAEFAVLIYATLQEVNSPLLGGSASVTPPPVGNLEQISGTIANIFAPFRSIQVNSANLAHNNRILLIANNAIITIGGVGASFSDLTIGTPFTASINANSEIVSINVQGQPTQPPTTTAPNPENIRTLDGIVYRINTTNNTIGIQTRRLDIRGEIITEIVDYRVAPNAVINRHGATTPITLPSITIGELAIIQIYNNNAINIQLEQRIRDITGILIEKDFSNSSLFPIFVIQDDAGNNYRILTNQSSVITRHGLSNIMPRQVRLGDRITLRAEYGTMVSGTATGTSSVADVYIRAIFISGREQSHIVVSETATATAERRHLIIDGSIDINALQIGTRVRLFLESDEVAQVVTLQQTHAVNFTGHLLSATTNQIIVRDDNFTQRTFTVDNATIIISSITGQALPLTHIPINARVNVSTTAANPNRANVIMVLTH